MNSNYGRREERNIMKIEKKEDKERGREKGAMFEKDRGEHEERKGKEGNV